MEDASYDYAGSLFGKPHLYNGFLLTAEAGDFMGNLARLLHLLSSLSYGVILRSHWDKLPRKAIHSGDGCVHFYHGTVAPVRRTPRTPVWPQAAKRLCMTTGELTYWTNSDYPTRLVRIHDSACRHAQVRRKDPRHGYWLQRPTFVAARSAAKDMTRLPPVTGLAGIRDCKLCASRRARQGGKP